MSNGLKTEKMSEILYIYMLLQNTQSTYPSGRGEPSG